MTTAAIWIQYGLALVTLGVGGYLLLRDEGRMLWGGLTVVAGLLLFLPTVYYVITYVAGFPGQTVSALARIASGGFNLIGTALLLAALVGAARE